MIDIKI